MGVLKHPIKLKRFVYNGTLATIQTRQKRTAGVSLFSRLQSYRRPFEVSSSARNITYVRTLLLAAVWDGTLSERVNNPIFTRRVAGIPHPRRTQSKGMLCGDAGNLIFAVNVGRGTLEHGHAYTAQRKHVYHLLAWQTRVPTLILNFRPIPSELMLQEDGQSNVVVSAKWS